MNEKILHVDTGAPEFVVAAANELKPLALYWPGKDYPDRDEWLAKRAAQRVKPQARLVYNSNAKQTLTYAYPMSGSREVRQPLALGINNAKRMADARGDGNPKHSRGKRIVKHRHAYYRHEVKS